jgi:hypothetical protein
MNFSAVPLLAFGVAYFFAKDQPTTLRRALSFAAMYAAILIGVSHIFYPAVEYVSSVLH